ncbi:MAG: hypothetical protein M3A44_07910 [Gammaproteobacteria bacterium]
MEHDTPKSSKPKLILPNGAPLSKNEDSLPKTPLPTQHIGAWAGALLTLSTIILFASGEGYREGYLSGFSVDISQVPISFQETLYWGYLANASYGVIFLWILAISVIVLGGFMMFVGELQQRFPKLRQKKSAEKPTAKKHSPGLIVTFAGLGIMLIVYVLAIGYWIPKSATDHGRAQAEATMEAFITDETKAAEIYKLHCLQMSWEKEDGGKLREMYVYQFFCNDKLCKVFEPATKTFPTVFLDGIRSIVPRGVPADGRKSCVGNETKIGSK